MGMIFSETSITKYRFPLRNISEDRRPQSYRGGNLKLRSFMYKRTVRLTLTKYFALQKRVKEAQWATNWISVLWYKLNTALETIKMKCWCFSPTTKPGNTERAKTDSTNLMKHFENTESSNEIQHFKIREILHVHL